MAVLTLPRLLYLRAAFLLAVSRLAWHLVPVAGGLLLLLAALCSGLLLRLPGWAHAVILLASIGGLLGLLTRALRLWQWPRRRTVEAKVERASLLPHQPFRALEDTPAPGVNAARWQSHRDQVEQWLRLGRLRSGGLAWPSRWGVFLLRCLGLPALLLVLALHQADDAGGNALRSFRLPFMSPSNAAMLTVAVVPPARYGLETMTARPGQNLTVPAGSTVRHGHFPIWSHMRWRLGDMWLRGEQPSLGHAGELRVYAWFRDVTPWRIRVAADSPPTAAWVKPPQLTPNNSMGVSWQAADDFGLRGVRLVVYRPGKRPRSLPLQQGTVPESTLKGLRYIDLSRLRADDSTAEQQGEEILLRLRARDWTGKTALSAPQPLRLPPLRFQQPLARAVMAQRRDILQSSPAAEDAPQTLRALAMQLPAGARSHVGNYLGLRTAAGRLQLRPDAKEAVAAQLLAVAKSIERHGGGGMLGDVRQAQDKLQAAIDSGDRRAMEAAAAMLEQALRQYLQAMAQHLGAPAANGGMTGQAPWQQQMERLKQMLATGQTEQAQAMLRQMQAMLENMSFQPVDPEQMRRAMEQQRQLQEMMKQQAALMDQTARQARRETVTSVGAAQEQLAGQLEKFSQGAQKNLQPPLRDAVTKMRQARDALRRDDAAGAVASQGEAVALLQKALRDLASEQGQALAPGGGGSNSWVQPGQESLDWRAPEASDARRILREIQQRLQQNGPAAEKEYLQRLLIP